MKKKLFLGALGALALGGAVISAVIVVAQQAVGQQASAQEAPADVAARVGDRVITLREVDAKWQQSSPGDLARAEQALYDGRKTALDQMIADVLIEQAARAKGTSVDQYVNDEITRRSKAVTPAAVEFFYAQNKAQMEGRALQDVQDLIRNFLDEQQKTEARAALVADLRKSAPPISMVMDAPRQAVAIGPQDPIRGLASAPITLVEFSDYQCPFCGRVTPTLKRITETYGDRIRIVWKDYPLEQIHPQAKKAAEAAHCAGEQSKYWEFHDRLFSNQSALAVDQLKQHALVVGMDGAKFNACLDSGRYATRVFEGTQAGNGLGVNSTPTVFINGRMVMGAQPYEVFQAIIDEELARANKR